MTDLSAVREISGSLVLISLSVSVSAALLSCATWLALILWKIAND